MSTDSGTATCKTCFEEVDVRAKRCPHCGSARARGIIAAVVPALFSVAVIVALAWYAQGRVKQMLPQFSEVAQYAGHIRIVDSEMFFGESAQGRTVFVVGMLSNDSDVPWERIGMEVQFRDPDGKLIDVEAEDHYVHRIQPRGKMAFKLHTVADLPLERYASYEVHVREAEDARVWP